MPTTIELHRRPPHEEPVAVSWNRAARGGSRNERLGGLERLHLADKLPTELNGTDQLLVSDYRNPSSLPQREGEEAPNEHERARDEHRPTAFKTRRQPRRPSPPGLLRLALLLQQSGVVVFIVATIAAHLARSDLNPLIEPVSLTPSVAG